MTKYSPAEYSPVFKTWCVAINIWRIINTIASNARIFVLGHYLFLKAHSFPRASLSENSSLLGTDDVRGQISEHIFKVKWRLLFIYRDLSVSPRSIICRSLRLRQIIDMFATDKSQYFAQPHAIIVKYWIAKNYFRLLIPRPCGRRCNTYDNRPFYCCLLSYLAFGWQRGWS